MKYIDVCISDDYATLSTYNYGFYYGYEFDSKETEDGEVEDVYGFEVCDRENIGAYRISYKDMSKYPGCPSEYECDKCLLFGIGVWLENEKTNI